MTSTAPVGPLPTIRFRDGTQLAYQPPRDTCDPRYAACREHQDGVPIYRPAGWKAPR